MPLHGKVASALICSTKSAVSRNIRHQSHAWPSRRGFDKAVRAPIEANAAFAMLVCRSSMVG